MTTITASEARGALAELVDLVRPHLLPDQEPGEYTVTEIADQINAGNEVPLTPSTLKPVLDDLVRRGEMTAREVRARSGKRAMVYRKVTKG